MTAFDDAPGLVQVVQPVVEVLGRPIGLIDFVGQTIQIAPQIIDRPVALNDGADAQGDVDVARGGHISASAAAWANRESRTATRERPTCCPPRPCTWPQARRYRPCEP